MTSTGPPWVTVGHRLFQGSKSLEISHLHNPGLRQDPGDEQMRTPLGNHERAGPRARQRFGDVLMTEC